MLRYSVYSKAKRRQTPTPEPLSQTMQYGPQSDFPAPHIRLPISASDAESVAGIPAGRLTVPDNLDNLPPPETKVLGHGVRRQDTRELRLLQTVPLQQGDLLVARQQHVFRHELVVRDVDEQIRLEEALDLGVGLDALECLARRGRERDGRHHDAKLVVVVNKKRRELADLRDTELLLVEELNPDGTDLGRRRLLHLAGGRVLLGRGSVLANHGLARARGELQAVAVDGAVLADAELALEVV